MTISIRTAAAADIDRCVELLFLARNAPADAAEGERAVFERLLDLERGQVFVAVDRDDGDRVVGMATVSYNLAMRYRGEYCQLEELFVEPAARGRNAGGLLVQHTIANARERGCAEYGLYIDATERTRPFYERYGLAVIGPEMRMGL